MAKFIELPSIGEALLYFGLLNVCVAFAYNDSFLLDYKDVLSEKCFNDTSSVYKNLENLTLWATTMWDATAKGPTGFLYGSHAQLGNFDECLAPVYRAPAPPAQYCLFEVALLVGDDAPREGAARAAGYDPYASALDKIRHSAGPAHGRRDRLSWAWCLPRACAGADRLRLARALLAHSELARAGTPFRVALPPDACQHAHAPSYGADTVGFVWLLSLITAAALICTIYHWYLRDKAPEGTELQVPAMVLTWSLLKNAASLKHAPSGDMSVLHSMKFISISLIIFAHRIGTMLGGPVSNIEQVESIFRDIEFQFIIHSDLVVDTFFAIGGLLLVRSLLSSTKNNPAFIMIFLRYIRIVPAYALVMYFTASVIKYTGSGPYWPLIMEHESNACKQTWWAGLLMLGNYIRDGEICIISSWYIPCDFHFFVVGVAICWMIRTNRKAGLAVLGSLLLVSLIIVGTITAIYRLPAIMLFFTEFHRHPRESEYLQKIYIKSHTRISSYLVGMLAGYIAHVNILDKKRISKLTATAGVVLSLVIMIALVVSGVVFYDVSRPYKMAETVIYGTIHRPLWAMAICLFTMSCSFGEIPLLSDFLTMKFWIPLGKLTYCMYLVHMPMQIRDMASVRQPQTLAAFSLLARAVGDIAMAGLVSLFLHLCVELPFRGMFQMMVAASSRQPSRRREFKRNIITNDQEIRETASDDQYKPHPDPDLDGDTFDMGCITRQFTMTNQTTSQVVPKQ